MGQSQVDAVESWLYQALLHMLKAEAWPLSEAVPHWQAERAASVPRPAQISAKYGAEDRRAGPLRRRALCDAGDGRRAGAFAGAARMSCHAG